jgi:HEAT repeat protein
LVCRRCGQGFTAIRQAEPPRARAGHRFWLFLAGTIGCGVLVLTAIALIFFVFTAGAVDQKLKDLKGSDPDKSAQALAWLTEAEPQEDQRPRVTAALENLMADSHSQDAQDLDRLLHAYINWADKDNIPTMSRLIQHPPSAAWNNARRGMLIAALGKLHDERAAAALAELLPSDRLHEQALSALEDMGPEAEKAVINYLFHGHGDTRRRAARLLAAYGTQPQVLTAAALARLQSTQPNEKYSAVAFFVDHVPAGPQARADAAPLLTQLLDDPSPEVRRQALLALRSWATTDSLPRLLEFARSKQLSSGAHETLIEVLDQFQDPRAAEALALQLPNPRARSQAVRALLRVGPNAGAAVLKYLDDPDEAVRKAARDLCQLLDITSGRQLDQILIDINDNNVARSRAALQSLAVFRVDETARSRVAAALNSPLLDANKDIRADALNAVKTWGNRANTANLLKLLQDYQKVDWPGYQRIVEVLGSLRDPAAAPALAEGLTYPQPDGAVSRALMTIGAGAESAVVPYLRSSNRDARLAASRILANIGTSKSLPALRDAMPGASGDPILVQSLEDAMQKIQARR